MSEGVLEEILNTIYEKRGDYTSAAEFAHMKGDNSLYNFNKGANAALEDLEDMICGYLGGNCPKEEEHE